MLFAAFIFIYSEVTITMCGCDYHPFVCFYDMFDTMILWEHLIFFCLHFRPVNFHMPMRALLTVQKFSLAVNLNTKTNYTPLK